MGIEAFQEFHLHPGIWVKQEIIDLYAMSLVRCAALLRIDLADLLALLHGESPLTPDIALRFQNQFGIKAATLLAMQAEYDFAHAQIARRWLQADRRTAA